MDDTRTVHEAETQIRESCIVESIDTSGHAVRATVIRGGKSINGYLYDEHALQSIAQLIEGAHAYADHGDASQVTRSMRDLVGFYKDARYIAGNGMDAGRVDATLHILESAGWLWSIIQESHAINKPDLIGLSIDIFAHCQQQNDAKAVTKVLALHSCDIVTRPSAGGSINRILHSVGSSGTEGIASMEQNLQVAVEQNLPVPVAGMPSLAEVQDDIAIQIPSQPDLVQEIVRMQEQQRLIETQRAEMERLLAHARLDRAQVLLERRLQETHLPNAVCATIKERFAGRVFEADELDKEIGTQLNMLARLTRDGLVRGHGFDRDTIVGSQITEAEKIQASFDLMMGVEIDTARMGNIRGFTSIRDAYARVTGDPNLMGGIASTSLLGQIAIHESAPIVRISEVDTTTASFSYLLGTSMNKRLLKDYQAWPAEWMKFCTIVPIRDYKQQTRIRTGAFGTLALVPEDNTYQSVTLTDTTATYVPQKRGNTVAITRETILNDDLQAIKQIPTKLAVAAAYTLAEYVYNFLSSNQNIYDGSPLFTTGAPHSNFGSASLSTVAMQIGITVMREQTNFANKRLGLRPRFLVVPPELEFTAMIVTKSAGVPGSNNNDINPMLGYVTPIVSPQLTTPNQWFLVGDPREIDTIEIGFVGGQVNPALFIQDGPLFGANFTQDVITYKIRHEYGGCVTDYRGLYRGI